MLGISIYKEFLESVPVSRGKYLLEPGGVSRNASVLKITAP